MEILEHLGIIDNINPQLSDISFNSFVNIINGKEVWIRYYTGGKKDYRSTIDGRDSINDVPNIMVYISKGKGVYQSYRYNGILKYQRIVERGLTIYTVRNLAEIRDNIESFIQNSPDNTL